MTASRAESRDSLQVAILSEVLKEGQRGKTEFTESDLLHPGLAQGTQPLWSVAWRPRLGAGGGAARPGAAVLCGAAGAVCARLGGDPARAARDCAPAVLQPGGR